MVLQKEEERGPTMVIGIEKKALHKKGTDEGCWDTKFR